MPSRKALLVATYDYRDTGLRRLAAPEHDAESFAAVLEDPDVAGFDVTMLVNEPHHVVGEAIADFYAGCRRDDLALLYFSGHGLKDDEGRLHLAMSNTRREALLFTAISAAQLNDAMDASASRRKVLILDCCYSGAFPAGRAAKSDEGVQTLERFQGKGRAVLTASDATQYAFEGNSLTGAGSSSVFTRYLVEAIRSGAADLDEDGDIALDELYSYVRDRVVAEMPQQRPKKQEDVDGRILIARNVHWTLPAHLRHAIESPISAQRLSAVEGLARLHRVGNDGVRAAVAAQLAVLAADDSRSVSAGASALLERIGDRGPLTAVPSPRAPAEAAPPRVAPAEADRAAAERAAADRAAAEVAAERAAAERAAAERGEIDRAEADRVVARVGAEPRSPSAPPSPAGTADSRSGEPPLWLLLGLLAAGGMLLVLARLVVFEPVNGKYAVDLGFGTAPWLVWVGIPLLLAGQLLIVRASVPRAPALAVGLVAGALLTQLDLVLETFALMLDGDTNFGVGTGWMLALLGTVVLGTVVALAIRRPPIRARPAVQRNGRAAWAAVLLFTALAAWMSAYQDFYLWFAANMGAFLLVAVALPVALLELNPAQRLAGLAAVTVLGGWLSTTVLEQLLRDSFWNGSASGITVVASALSSVAACYLAQARRPGRPAEAATAPAARPPGLPGGPSRLALLTPLLVGGVLLLLSRFLVFESTGAYTASDVGVHWLSWLVGAGLPLALALQMLVQRADVPWAVPLAGGLVSAAALGQLDLVLASGNYYWIWPDTSEQAGPGWWATLLGAVVLTACAVRILRGPELRGRPRPRRDRRGLVAVLLVVAALLAWLVTFRWGTPWFTHNEPALLLAAVCLPVAALGLEPAQRIFGLAAVTVLGLWVASQHVQALIEQDFIVDAEAAVVGILSVCCSVAACYLAQSWRGERRREVATAEPSPLP